MTVTMLQAARSALSWGALAGLALVLLLALAAPARAHTGGQDASNYRSAVAGLVQPGGADRGDVEGLDWEVLANDALLSVHNDTGREVVVKGYEGESYLRIGPEGVFRNRNSPATYLNQDRYGLVDVPSGATPDAPADWEQVSTSPAWYWHDHRIHWMAATDPPQVKVDPARQVEVLHWEVPFSLDGEDLAVAGTLTYIPPPPSWPWLGGAVVAMSGALALAARGHAGSHRRRALVGGAAGALAVTAALTAVRAVDDVLTVPAAVSEDALALGIAALVVLPALGGALWAAKGGPSAALLVLAGGLLLFVGTVADAWMVLSSSQVATSLPVAFARLIAALEVAVLLPVAVSGWALRAGEATRRERPSARAGAVAGSVVVLLALSGCAASEPAAVAGPTDRCDPVESVPVQGGAHLIGDREPPVPYNSVPPTSGWHASGAFDIDVRDASTPLSEPEQVSILEVGGIVVTHHGLPEAEQTALADTVAREFDGRVAVTPYDALEEGMVAFTSWGIVQRCEGLDLDALEGFVTTYGDDRPGVPGEH